MRNHCHPYLAENRVPACSQEALYFQVLFHRLEEDLDLLVMPGRLKSQMNLQTRC